MDATGLQRLWLTRSSLKFVASSGWQSRAVLIPGIDLLEPSELEEILLWQEEQAVKEMRQATEPKPLISEMPHAWQHQFGDHLAQIKASKERVALVGHGRYW